MRMARQLLILTPPGGFGELMRQALLETGRYAVTMQHAASELLARPPEPAPALAIVDADACDITPAACADGLRRLFPEIRLVLLPPENDPRYPSVREIQVDGYLSKPFYLPDLLETVQEALGEVEPGAPAGESSLPQTGRLRAKVQAQWQAALTGVETPTRPTPARPPATTPGVSRKPAPAWLEDPAQAASRLARLSLESAAQAALIGHGSQIWAAAGSLSQPALQELNQILRRQWERAAGKDFTQYVRLAATAGEYMLYGTSLGGDYVLGQLFDVQTPFSRVRQEAARLAQGLALEQAPRPAAVMPPAEAPAVKLPPAEPPAPAAPASPDDPLAMAGWLPEYTVTPAATAAPTLKANSVGMDLAAGLVDAGLLAASEGEAPVISRLHYACLLAPRLPQHDLSGDLVQSLTEWMPQLCLAFGWRLEYISVLPGALHWIVSATPGVAPAEIINQVRRYTSKRLMGRYPRLHDDNPSGEFWAPGYLITTRNQPLDETEISQFISQVRQHQGLNG